MTAKEKVLKVWPDIIVYRNKIMNRWFWFRESEPDKTSDYFDSEEAAWQNAAESLPQPAQECDCPFDGLGPLCDYCCNKPPVEAQEKEQCASCGEFYEWINANSECARCDAKSCTRPDCDLCKKIFAEPKPTLPEPVASAQNDIQASVRAFLKGYESIVINGGGEINSAGLWAGVKAVMEMER